jgi:hypothetical protein
MQALTEELFGFAERFLCFFQTKDQEQRVPIQILEYNLINGREVSVYEVSSPQSARRCKSGVVFAG